MSSTSKGLAARYDDCWLALMVGIFTEKQITIEEYFYRLRTGGKERRGVKKRNDTRMAICFQMREAGYSLAEISETLGISRGLISSNVSKVRRKLKEERTKRMLCISRNTF